MQKYNFYCTGIATLPHVLSGNVGLGRAHCTIPVGFRGVGDGADRRSGDGEVAAGELPGGEGVERRRRCRRRVDHFC